MAAGNPAVTRVLREAQNLGARVKSAEAPPEAEKRGAFEEGPRFPDAPRPPTGRADGGAGPPERAEATGVPPDENLI